MLLITSKIERPFGDRSSNLRHGGPGLEEREGCRTRRSGRRRGDPKTIRTVAGDGKVWSEVRLEFRR
ncbi:MAG: hypothetical protein PHN90_03185 [Methanothrix sp.]|nr:hypothetical protein [Methanothrix sp.]